VGAVRWKDANCRGMNPNVFFPDLGDTEGAERAKAICRGCPVKRECLEYALSWHPPVEGVWGGTSEMDRQLTANSRLRRRNLR